MENLEKINKLLDDVDNRLSIHFKERVKLDLEKKGLIKELEKNLLEKAKDKGFEQGVEVNFFRESVGMKKPFKTKINFIFMDQSLKDDRRLKAVLEKDPKEFHNKFFPNPTLEELTVIK